MWTSEALSRLAWVRIRVTTWTIGASSATISASAFTGVLRRVLSTASKASTSRSTPPMAR